jgi:pyruvate carboxylase
MNIRQKFNKLMVANRGEIAIRIFRAATELGIRTVAIYTFEDRYSLHRYKADESYQVGKDDEPLRPYLDIEEIITVAKRNKVDAIHPGYGFLSENEHFARRCREEDIVFIGPDPEVMQRLGDKVAAKTLAQEVNVPLIESNKFPLTNETVALEEARRIGFPLMVKAVAGGGGRGMRIVREELSLIAAFNEAKGEAKTAFGDDTVFFEKYIDNPKHIEVQILGDNYGNIVHLYERDCSVQRRFQKVVEIAPSLTLSQKTKQLLYDYALKLTREVNYNNAGTVEFLVDKEENIYFIEVNPRIQVEHTITEEITGIDIVRTQILVAMGYPLSHPTILIKNQDDVEISGFAIQCRITTEDPANGFKPDYGTLIAYRSPGGFGIRLDGGSAYTGANIPPYFDSLLVKVTAWGRTFKGAVERLQRALVEFRVRGVTTNIGFLENLMNNPTFQRGEATVNFIEKHPELLKMPIRLDRSNKLLRYLGNTIVNGNPDVKFIDNSKVFQKAIVPSFDINTEASKGTKQLLTELGPKGLADWLKAQKTVQYTDTTFRDAHQSLLATRIRTYDLRAVAESYAKNIGHQVFSVEMWGGATFDVSMRFLKENPWRRLEMLRERMPNTLLQMLLRGSNAVGYTNYPNNLVERFIEESGKKGIDIFRIFDSLNWIENMKPSIKAVRERTNSVAEVALCYTGDILDPTRKKFDLQYYLDLARRIEDSGAHILAIKDMAGLLKPYAAEVLIKELKKTVDLPIHLHTHDTSSIQSATYLKAIEAGVDAIDLALASMSGLTSQPNFNSVVAMMQGHEREQKIDLHQLNEFSNYFETIREYYYPFEAELKAGTAEVYEHEIPGGQYTNLRPQARALGLEDRFDTIKHNFKVVNELLGDIVKVTPSSKVVGDMAMFMTSNNLTKEDILERGTNLAFPESFKELLHGDLGQIEGGFPKKLVDIVLKGEQPLTGSPNEHLAPIDFDDEFFDFKIQFPYADFADFLSYKFYPKVFSDWYLHYQTYGAVREIPTLAFFYGLKPNEEVLIEIEKGKNILIQYLNMTMPNEHGIRTVFFRLNGSTRSLDVRDYTIKVESKAHQKARANNEIGAPLQGSLAKILVKVGQEVSVNTPLFTIEAMKMESTITAPMAGIVKKVHLREKTLVEQDDLVIEFE